MRTFSSFNSALKAVLTNIDKAGDDVPSVQDQTSIGSNFGSRARPFRELRSSGFSLTNPRSRVPDRAIRPINVPFALANVLWVLAGYDRLDWIDRYNPKGRQFSEGGVILEGAFGPRLFGKSEGTVAHCVRLLTEDRSTRRAVAPIFLPTDIIKPKRDTPCAALIQFFVRKDQLHMLVMMRSQSAFSVMPYDAFLFTMVMEYIAAKLGVELGMYHHVCGSLHVYEDERAAMRLNIARGQQSVAATTMPPWILRGPSEIETILEVENELRKRLKPLSSAVQVSRFIETVRGFDKISVLWQEFLKILAFHGAGVISAKNREQILEHIPLCRNNLGKHLV